MDDFFDPYAVNYNKPPRSAARSQSNDVNAPIEQQVVPAPVQVALNDIPPVAQPEVQPQNDIWAERNRREEERRAQIAADEAVARALEGIELGALRDAPVNPLMDRVPDAPDIFRPAPRNFYVAPVQNNDCCCKGPEEFCEDIECCCGCTGFYCFEGWSIGLKYLLHSLVLALSITMMVLVGGASRPVEDLVSSWNRRPIMDMAAVTSDGFCPSGYQIYGDFGKDEYTTGGRKSRTIHTEYFNIWKSANFCTTSGSYSAPLDRPRPINGACPKNEQGQDYLIMCSGMCFEGTKCPIGSVSFSRTTTPIPIEEGVVWVHKNTFYSLEVVRLTEGTQGATPFLGFSVNVSKDNPPVKCLGQSEDDYFTHDFCRTPDLQYTLIDRYDYQSTNNVKLFYMDNLARSYDFYYQGIERENVGLFTRNEPLFLDDSCPLSRADMIDMKYYTTVIYRVTIALLVMVSIEFLWFFCIAPIAFVYACENDKNCFTRCSNAFQLSTFSGFVLSMVLLIYICVMNNDLNTILASGACFESDFQPVFIKYQEEVIIFLWLTAFMFGSRAVNFVFDSLYCCLWPFY